MPEGHTLHRLARALNGEFAGRVTRSSSPQGRFEAGAARVDGRRLDHAEAYGKHLFVAFAADVVHVHLGLYGRLTLEYGPERPPVGAVRWRLAADEVRADLRGPNVCEVVRPDEVEDTIAGLGPDPVRADADPEAAWRRIVPSRSPVAGLLADQRVVAGVGNVFRAEVLFRNRVDPMMEGRFLRRSEWVAIWHDLVVLMALGVDSGRIDTVRPEHEPEAMGRPPREDDHGGEVYVYRRTGAPCLVCETAIRRRELAGRNLFWCPRCQPRSRRRVPQGAAKV